MKKFLKAYLFVTVMFGDFILFAQDPGTDFEDEDGDIDGSVENVPINGKVLWLAVAIILFSFYHFRNMNKKYVGAEQSE